MKGGLKPSKKISTCSRGLLLMGCEPRVLQALPPWFRGNIVRTQECISFKKIWGRENGFTDDCDHNHLGFAVGGEEKQELTTNLIKNKSLNNFFGYFWTLCGVFKNHLISKNWPLENPEPCACSHVPNLKALSFCQYLQIYDHMTMTMTIIYYLPLEYLARSG